MTPNPSSPAVDPLADALPELRNFSLVLGGPLYQFLRRTRLDDDAGQLVGRRIVLAIAIIWAPLLVLCTAEGTLREGAGVPFLYDAETHARFLVTVPLLLLAELVVHLRLRGIIAQFVERGLVCGDAMERFTAAVRSAMAWRNSWVAELALIAFVYPVGHLVREQFFALEGATWYATVEAGATTLTLAGYWLVFVSNPLMQFLLLRWAYRILIWARFLWQTAQIPLRLVPTHPDGNGGLGFLGQSAYALAPILTAMGASVAGNLANRIFHEGASLASFKLDIVLLVLLGMLLVLAPLLVFAPVILAAKRQGLRDYGNFATEYTRDFDRRWLRSRDRDGEPLLGTGDIQSLADLANAYAIVRGMRPVIFTRDLFVQLCVAILLPFVPLVFTMIPLEQLLDRIIGAIF